MAERLPALAVGPIARPRRVRFRMTPLARREARWGLFFLSPWIIGFVGFTFLPMIATAVLTFLNVTLSQREPLELVGLGNYQRVLFEDPQVWQSLSVTLRFAVLWLPVALVVPFVLALALNSRYLRGARLFRVLFFMPYVVPFVAAALIWQQMLGVGGWINEGLMLLGINEPPEWIHDTTWIHPSLVIIGLWGIGAGIIINLAGLRAIPTEYYDAARIDGAGTWATLRHITVPMMSPILFYSLILGVVEVFQYFLAPLVLLNGTGEPGGETLFYNLHLYNTFFLYQEMSYGATLAWLLFAITLVVTVVLFRTSRRWVYYAGER
jgi:multiple sugar transport system permease protein